MTCRACKSNLIRGLGRMMPRHKTRRSSNYKFHLLLTKTSPSMPLTTKCAITIRARNSPKLLSRLPFQHPFCLTHQPTYIQQLHPTRAPNSSRFTFQLPKRRKKALCNFYRLHQQLYHKLQPKIPKRKGILKNRAVYIEAPPIRRYYSIQARTLS